MKRMRQILVVFTLLLASLAYAQDSAGYLIDIQCEQCMSLESNSSTNSMVACLTMAQEEWTSEIDRYYRLLSDTLSDESIKLLEHTQEVWLNYRDAQIKYLISFYHSDISGGNHIERNAEIRNLIRARALVLKTQYDTLKEQ